MLSWAAAHLLLLCFRARSQVGHFCPLMPVILLQLKQQQHLSVPGLLQRLRCNCGWQPLCLVTHACCDDTSIVKIALFTWVLVSSTAACCGWQPTYFSLVLRLGHRWGILVYSCLSWSWRLHNHSTCQKCLGSFDKRLRDAVVGATCLLPPSPKTGSQVGYLQSVTFSHLVT